MSPTARPPDHRTAGRKPSAPAFVADAMRTHSRTKPAGALAWTWSNALRCGLCTLPAAVTGPTVANEQVRFAERVGETAFGVGLAYVFGLPLPRLLKRRSA
jgi:hypothetical protein